MDGYLEFKKIAALVPENGEEIDWLALGKTALAPIFDKMSKTYQNPDYHGENDVLSHTRLVCGELIKQPEYKRGNERDRIILFVAALLHDIGKIACTVEVDGVFKSPHHSSKGAIMARRLLWCELGLCGTPEKQELREAICNLIRYHSFPPYAVNDGDVELKLLKIAANGLLVRDFSIEKLCTLERADALGRVATDTFDVLERVEYCASLAAELGCLTKPYEFASDFSQRAFFKEKTAWREQDMYNDTWGRVVLMCGLPGTGKDTFIKENYSDLPMISLDEIRKELGVSPKDNQGRVVALGHERAKELLRKKQPFVWNATNISLQMREMQISLFEDYGAAVETVFLETDLDEQLRRNQSRDSEVPVSAIERMFSRLSLPERFESERVSWKIV